MYKALYEAISDCFDDRTEQDVAKEIGKIFKVLKAEEELYLSPIKLIGLDFELNKLLGKY